MLNCMLTPAPFPANGRTLWGSTYLAPITEQGVEAYMESGNGLSMQVRVINERLVPILVSDGKPGKASFAFPRGHYLYYPIHEIARSSRWWSKGSLRVLLSPLECLLFAGEIDRVVYINHWLLVGGPRLRVDTEQLHGLLIELKECYPDHALVVSGVVPRLDPNLAGALMEAGGRAVQSRVIYILDPRRSFRGGAMKNIRNTRTADLRLYHRFQSQRTNDASVLRQQSQRVSRLYDEIYVHKHPGELNPRYNSRFFELVATSGIFTTVGWHGENGLEAFNIQLRCSGVIVWSAFGVDGSQPRSRGLMRLAATDDVVATEQDGLMLNWGGGNDEFKLRRGGMPEFEFDIVFDRHLPEFRRFPWRVLQHARAWKNGASLDPVNSTGEEQGDHGE